MGKRDSLLLTLLLLPLHADVQVLADIEVRSDRLSGSDTLIRGDTFLSAAPMQQQIRVEKALQVAGTNGDPVKALQSLAGVVSTGNDNASEIYIHGAKPRETYYNINHLPLGYVFHLGGLHSVIAPEAVEQIDAYLGGFDVTYEAMGAVVDVLPAYPTGKNEGRVHLGMYDADFAYDAKLSDNTALFISGRRSYFDFFADVIFDGKLFEDGGDKSKKVTYTLFPQFYDMQATLIHTMENQDISLEMIHAADQLKINTTVDKGKDPVATGKVNNKVKFSTIGLRWNYDQEAYSAMTLLSHLNNTLELDLFDADYYVDLNPQQTTLYHQSIFHHFRHHTPMIGFELSYNKTPIDAYATGQPTGYDFEELVTDQTPVTLNKTFIGKQYTLFAQDIWDITLRNHFRYGVRVWKTDFQDFEGGIDPRIAFVHDLQPDLSLSLAVGKYSQFPEDSYVVEGYGNPKIDTSEFSIHYALNLTKTFEENGKLSIEPYFKTFENLVIDDAFEKYKAIGEGKAYGLDITYRHRWEALDLTFAYTYVNAQRQLFTDSATQYSFQGDIPHTLQLSTQYRISDYWRVSSLFKYSSGAPYTPVTGTEDFIYNGETYKRPLYGDPYSQRLPGLWDLDIQIGKEECYGYKNLECTIELMNVTALFKDNVVAYSYDDNYNIDGEVTNLGFVPAAHFTYRF